MSAFSKVMAALRDIARHPTTRGSKLYSIGNYCVTQVLARFAPGDLCVPFVNHTFLLFSPRMKGAAHYVLPGLHDFEAMSFLAHLLRPGELFIDIGANVGAYALLAATAKARVICFEPSPTAFRYLKRNCSLNSLNGEVSLREVALADTEGESPFTDDLGMENHLCPPREGGRAVVVKVETLDHALEGVLPAVVKIDVEGAESKVFSGARKTLSASSLLALIIERCGYGKRYGADEAALHRAIQNLSFVPCGYAPLERRLYQLQDVSTGNVLYVRDFEGAQARLRAGPMYEFRGYFY